MDEFKQQSIRETDRILRRGELSPFAVLGIDTCEVGGLGSTGSLGRLAMGGRSSTS